MMNRKFLRNCMFILFKKKNLSAFLKFRRSAEQATDRRSYRDQGIKKQKEKHEAKLFCFVFEFYHFVAQEILEETFPALF